MVSMRAVAAAAAALLLLACCVFVKTQSPSAEPDELSMFHMWLGPNGLPLSPRKQKAMLFQFCTSNFVTEAEMRYCYAQMLAVGSPSGPVKFEGQPQYDSEQIVAPLFSFAAPAESEGGEEPAAERAPVTSLVQEQKRAAAAASKSDAAVAAVAAAAQVVEQKKELARQAAKVRGVEMAAAAKARGAAMVAAQKKIMLHAQAVERKEAAKLEQEEVMVEQRAAARKVTREAAASAVARARTAAAKGQAQASIGLQKLQKLPAVNAADEWSTFVAKEKQATAKHAAAAALAKQERAREEASERGGVAKGRKMRSKKAELAMQGPWYKAQPDLAI